ncbi:glucosamine-6-phosphate deaminase [Segnochrobactrum spirostomi]|uniref:Glucosamine-6-phosphate deaminase n=1 Tax=Segnochrobactrum spirostomi TaxID=2608987 RepID=A0A6A7Y085_9HYPH|nr:glucosamine-6-phosphate deaminase [Segnochrobactrum spirostomi]MQT11797.1 glucosamine-6-phosphate deaminase [Segnochrobactrum spirostomi]
MKPFAGADHAIRIEVLDDAEAVGRRACDLVCETLSAPSSVLGLATGGTVEPLYAALITRHRAGGVSFAHASSFNLDEYVGLSPDHPASYRATMRRLLFDHVDIDAARTFLPHGAAADLDAEATAYEAAIRAAGGIDLQLLGIGSNGHIGFNEPGSPLASRTRVVALTEETRTANSRFFGPGETVPTEAITMGIATILEARRILMLATGTAKAEAIAAALHGPVGDACPASALQLHGAVTVLADRAAAARLG